MKNEFTLAFNEVLEDKQLPKDVIMEALQAAMVSAYRRAVNASNAQLIEARIDPETGKVSIFAEKEIVDKVEDERTEVTLKKALKVDLEAEIGGMVVVESTPKNFGRVAAQTARQVIQQRLREAERDSQFEHFSSQVGEIMSGVVQAVGGGGITLGLEKKAEGLMPRNHLIPRERFRVHDRVRALLMEVKTTARGPQIILSRAHRNFLRRLLENEVPEIYHGMVEIRSIAREPGQRSKVAVAALQPGVDPVGACVGIRGVRIQAIVRELNDEKIDVIEWNSDPAIYISKSLSPARVSGVFLDETSRKTKTATVVVPEDQLSLAIGRDGQNARLAAKLTSWRIDIKSLPEAAADALYKLQNDPEYAFLVETEGDAIPQVELILAKKSEGRPVTPEEYHLLTQFVDQIERGIIHKRQEVVRVEEEREQLARAMVPPRAFEVPLKDFEVSDRVFAVISEAGFETVGDLYAQMKLDPDEILALHGMGPKGMAELDEALEKGFPPEEEPLAEEEIEAVEEAEPADIEATVSEETEVEELEVEELEVEVIEEPEPELIEAGAEPELELVGEVEAAPPEGIIEAPEPVAEVEEVIEEEEEISSLEEIFAKSPEVLDFSQFDDEEFEDDEDDEEGERKRKKKKRKRYVELEYDPDMDVTVAKKKRKRGDDQWDKDW